MEASLECGADDVITHDDGSFEVITAPHDYSDVKEKLEAKGFVAAFGEVTMKADIESELSGEDGQKMQKLLDAIEMLDDVQDVYTNAVIVD